MTNSGRWIELKKPAMAAETVQGEKYSGNGTMFSEAEEYLQLYENKKELGRNYGIHCIVGESVMFKTK